MIGVLISSLIAMILYVIGLLVIVIQSKKSAALMFKNGMILFIAGYVITFIIFYFALPAITVPNMLIANTVIAIILLPILLMATKTDKKVETRLTVPITSLLSFAIIAIIVVVIVGVASLDNAYESISKAEQEEAKPLTKDQTPITVAPEFARNKIQKAMSVVPNTQFYDLGKLQVQEVNGEVIYVAPVEFADFFKYLRGKETAGYFTISATDVNAQPKFHEEPMTYTNSSYFSKYVNRVIYNKYPQYIQSGEAQIELDDEGKTWYVQTVYRPISITNKPNLQNIKAVVIDPQTGDLKMYDADKAPEFIEGSISSEMATLENKYFGKYIHGWLNSLFGKRDVKIPNESGVESSVTPIFDEEGEMYYFTDFTSPKENIDSALGYSLIHARTGELTYYSGEKNSGIMDSEGAKQIVNKEFPEKKWEGYMPVLYNIDGNPTWVVNVLDPNGLHKQYAYIKANDSDFVVFGNTASETLDAYRMALLQRPGNVEATDDAVLENRSGSVARVLVTSTEQGQAVQFLLQNDKTIYTVNASKFPHAIFLQPNDEIEAEILVIDDNNATIETLKVKGLID